MVIHDDVHVARVAYRCDYDGCTINPGDSYHRLHGLHSVVESGDTQFAARVCMRCYEHYNLKQLSSSKKEA